MVKVINTVIHWYGYCTSSLEGHSWIVLNRGFSWYIRLHKYSQWSLIELRGFTIAEIEHEEQHFSNTNVGDWTWRGRALERLRGLLRVYPWENGFIQAKKSSLPFYCPGASITATILADLSPKVSLHKTLVLHSQSPCLIVGVDKSFLQCSK